MQEPIRLKSECISCIVKSSLESFPENTPEDAKREYMQRVLAAIAGIEKHHGGPIISRAVQAIQKEMFGMTRDYSEIKRYFNQMMMNKVSELYENVEKASDSLELALKYAMIGNYIDFGTPENVDEEKLEQYFTEAIDKEVPKNAYEHLQDQLSKAKRVTILLDNCGEIVLDKLLVTTIKKQYPQIEVTAIVRGGAVLNDVTIEDAMQTQFDEVANVIDSGSNIAGTCLDLISEDAKETIEDSDLILSKGQGNFETLYGCEKNVFYIFLCKCDMFAKKFNVPKFTGMLIHEMSL